MQELLSPDWSLLDVGAGTGRFALPLSEWARSVTALDHSAAMLDVLRAKITGQPVELVCGALEDTPVERHDVVLAAWALYRSPDLESSLRRLLSLARRRLLILEDDGQGSPHKRFRRHSSPTLPRASLIAGVLRQMGCEVQLEHIQEERRVTLADEAELLRRFGTVENDPHERGRFLNFIEPYIQRGDQLTYAWSFTVTLIGLEC